MPHKQKENHDHSSKSKKERQQVKQGQQAKKKAAADARRQAEEEAALLLPNNIALAEGAGAYEVGCEAEPEVPVRFNIKKRSKKHLRQDVRRNAERKEREEQELLQRQQEEQWRLQEQKEEEEEEEEEEIEEEEFEYLVYICECCGKKYATTNQFANHANSRKHKANAALYEEAGIIVTTVQLKVSLNLNDDDQYQEYMDNQFDDFEYGDGDSDSDDGEDEYYTGSDDVEDEVESQEEESEDEDDEPPQRPKVNIFSALAGDDSSSESEQDESDNEQDEKPAHHAPTIIIRDDDHHDDEEEQEELLEEIIQQNRILQSEIDAAENETDPVATVPTPLPFDDEQYNPDHFTADDNRLLSVHHRLQKKLAAKGIEPTRTLGGSNYGASDAISIGKTLLQQLMEANKDTLETRLEAYNKHKAEWQLLNKGFALAKGNSKALPGQYVYKPNAADDTRKRANVHHAGSHYHMQAARSMQFGRSKGMMARHSSQGARLQAKRMAAKETARMQTGGGGVKVGKTSKKSKQKSQGEAGGSKKSGGTASEK